VVLVLLARGVGRDLHLDVRGGEEALERGGACGDEGDDGVCGGEEGGGGGAA